MEKNSVKSKVNKPELNKIWTKNIHDYVPVATGENLAWSLPVPFIAYSLISNSCPANGKIKSEFFFLNFMFGV